MVIYIDILRRTQSTNCTDKFYDNNLIFSLRGGSVFALILHKKDFLRKKSFFKQSKIFISIRTECVEIMLFFGFHKLRFH